MILVIKGIFTYFLVAPLGTGVSKSNGGKNEADALNVLEKGLSQFSILFIEIFWIKKSLIGDRASASFFPPLEFETPIPRGATRKYVKIPIITKII